jgi:hypothetical protein
MFTTLVNDSTVSTLNFVSLIDDSQHKMKTYLIFYFQQQNDKNGKNGCGMWWGHFSFFISTVFRFIEICGGECAPLPTTSGKSDRVFGACPVS